MNTHTILHVTSSGRYDGSITRQVSDLVINYLEKTNPTSTIKKRDVTEGLPFVNEAWINANFTPADQRTDEQKQTLNFSDSLVTELNHADTLLIATPIYNFSIPATLKAWVDQICRVGQTFNYTETGPIGLLQNKKAIIVMASGGVPIGSEMDLASSYLKVVLGFIGITDVKIIDSSVINQGDNDSEQSTENQIAASLS